MEALLEFLRMGGYAFYVWTSYALVTVMLVLNLVSAMRRDRAVRERLRRLHSTGAAAEPGAQRT